MNRLAESNSPYLRQHANNPVDWYPWCDDALQNAASTDRPLLISIGYSACHWCHVMAHESFEDPQIAKLMNEWFVNIKVDREERPDIDAIYMEATQAMTGAGGWPMTVFATPDGRPFFAGTYFPPTSANDRPGFGDLLVGVHEAWSNNRDGAEAQADQLTAAVRARTSLNIAAPREIDIAQSTRIATEQLLSNADTEWGGFGRAPKFPQAPILCFLLSLERNEAIDSVITTSLDSMASGGIYDHLGGGFARYSTDAFWMVPHFEKMLYDQALLLRTYARAASVYQSPSYSQVAAEIVEYVGRDLTLPNGAIATAEDADSFDEEGHLAEGAFYLWQYDDLPPALAEWFGATKSGNFEGANILHRPERGQLIRQEEIEVLRTQQLDVRNSRPRPGRDDKVLVGVNAMWVSAVCEAGALLHRPEWIDRAVEIANVLRNEYFSAANSPMHTSEVEGFGSDYVWVIDAWTRLSEVTGDEEWRNQALGVAEQLLARFGDGDGGLYEVADGAESLIARPRDIFDGAVPSTTGVGVEALLRLGHPRALELLGSVAEVLVHHPTAACSAMTTRDPIEVSIPMGADALREVAIGTYRPGVIVLPSPPGSSGATVCHNQVCSAPTTDPHQLGELIAARLRSPT